MKVLLHTCCAPCLSGARIGFQNEEIPFSSFWYNPNIQPLTEHERRLATLLSYRCDDPFPLIEPDLRDDEAFRANIERYLVDGSVPGLEGLRVESRCDICYYMRLSSCALEAKRLGYDSFSTTLLLSKYQKHDRIKTVGRIVGDELVIDFLYLDLRKFWGRSLDVSRRFGLNRQRYCGCELSLMEMKRGPSKPIEKKSEVRIEPGYEDQ